MALQFFLSSLDREILTECKKANIECHSNFILYYLKLLALDPVWNLYPEMKEINRNDAVRLIKFVVSKMDKQFCPCIVTLKMQMYFDCNFLEKAAVAEKERRNLQRRLKPLEDEICESEVSGKGDMANLRKRIVYHSTLLRGLGNPTKIDVYREAAQALFSIYDDGELEDFTYQPHTDKVNLLNQMAQICSGIRVFNWSCKKGGEGIEDLPKISRNLYRTIVKVCESNLEETKSKIHLLTSAINYAFVIEELEKYSFEDGSWYYEYFMECVVPGNVTYEDIEYIKDLNIVYRQLEVYYRKILTIFDEIDGYIDKLNEELEQTLNHFHTIMYLKVGVNTDIIFPIFIKLDNIWRNYQDMIIHMTKMHQIVQNLETYVEEMHLDYTIIELIIGPRKVLTDITSTMSLEGIIDQFDIKLVPLDINTKLEFLGFCPWQLVETQGGLIPGNVSAGILEYQDKNYVFSCIEAALSFQEKPSHIINEALELARKKPELITLLNLSEELKEVQKIKDLVDEQKAIEEKVVHTETEMQTEEHPDEGFIDPKYKWNVWDLKREALTLADISKRKTKSVQTETSQNKNAVYTQTYETKSQSCQTKKDNYTGVPTPLTYFFGLRGRKDDKQLILDLTEPIQDPNKFKEE